MRELGISADELINALLHLDENELVCILDSCGVGHLGSHLLVAGIRPVNVIEVSDDDPGLVARIVDEITARDLAAIFSLSYDFGLKLQRISSSRKPADDGEPDLFLALFDVLIVHDYNSGTTALVGDENRFATIEDMLAGQRFSNADEQPSEIGSVSATSNFTREEYIHAVELIREQIRSGNTYQTNLTQQIRCVLPPGVTAESTYAKLRREHPAPFSAFLGRSWSTVVSASPERFFRVNRANVIEASPIKGTRRRGDSPEEDARLRAELVSSEKDMAENTMIVDLVRNDLGRVCEFGTVTVKKLCDLEEHPTLFHLVSTVSGMLRSGTRFSDILRAVFPCGSITGAPKIRTMRIIEELETDSRGLSMGAIGIYIPPSWNLDDVSIDVIYDLSVAIRTMVIRDGVATFNVGGGIVIDSVAEKEFDESMLKAKALLSALGASS